MYRNFKFLDLSKNHRKIENNTKYCPKLYGESDEQQFNPRDVTCVLNGILGVKLTEVYAVFLFT